jgi:tetratricopeptide (TPR) repeat protein
VQHIDIVPTLLDFVKAPIPNQLRGRSLKPLLEGTGKLPPAPVYSEALYARYHFGWSELTALTDERYRYIKAPREELYDLEKDAKERANLAPERAQAAQAMRGVLDRLAAGATIQAPAEVSADARERLQALGYVGAQTGPVAAATSELADPKDKREILERYRAAVDAASERRWGQAIALLQQILKDDPEMADVWAQLATFAGRIDRQDIALDAFKHYIALKPTEPAPLVGAANTLLKLRKYAEAREHAELSATVAGDNKRARAAAYQMVARVAVAQKDAEAAVEAARQAEEADPAMPTVAFVQGRLAYDQGRFDEAMPHFEQAIALLRTPGSRAVPELYYYAGDTLGRLERYHDAEVAFAEELKLYPQNARARGGLAMIYQVTDRAELADQTLRDMLRISPTPETYALASRLFTMFGNRREAEAVRADAKRAFGAPPRAAAAR